MSTIAIFGAAAFYEISQERADAAMQQVIDAGINHFDIAPGYGQAEIRLEPWMPCIRDHIFLGCKTMERTKAKAANELRQSLERMRVDKFDLFQLHGVTNMDELDQVMGKDGALEAIIEARDEGLLRYIGITGHGLEVPSVFQKALDRFDFDSVLIPVNFVLYSDPVYRVHAEALLEICQKRDVGVMAIKSIAKGPWGNQTKTHTTWYEPFSEEGIISRSVHFSLSQPVTGICTAADADLLPAVIEACESFSIITEEEQEDLIALAGAYQPIFPMD